jgi:hypothetical protein
MKKPFSHVFFIIFLSSLIFTCTNSASKSEDFSPDQSEILGFLDDLQQKWNSVLAPLQGLFIFLHQ